MRSAKLYAPALIFLIGSAFVWHTRSQAALSLAAPLTTILSQVDGYRTQDQKLSDDERRVAGMTDYVARAYWHDSVPAFSTFVSYYERQTQGKTIHSPRNCLPGAGWEVLTPGTQELIVDGKPQTVNHYVLRNGPATAVVLYWYQGRGRIVANEYVVKWNLLRDAAIAGHTEEALVRVVVPVPTPAAGAPVDAANESMADANALATATASKLASDVWKVLPRT